MGNQECSVKTAQECVRDASHDEIPWASGSKALSPPLAYMTAESSTGHVSGSSSREPPGGGGTPANSYSLGATTTTLGGGGGAFTSPSLSPELSRRSPGGAIERANALGGSLRGLNIEEVGIGGSFGQDLAGGTSSRALPANDDGCGVGPIGTNNNGGEMSSAASIASSSVRSRTSSRNGKGRDDPARFVLNRQGGSDEAPGHGSKAQKTYFDFDIGERPFEFEVDDAGDIREFHSHVFRSGAVYDGEWQGGMRDGLGRQRWRDGTVYIGEWRRGRAGGRGQLIHRDGDCYIGFWVNGRAHGLGTYLFQHGSAIYRGEFRCDLREGLGVESWADGSFFEGEFRKGEKCGFGQTRWPDGSNYVGSWHANSLDGPGRFAAKGGSVYQGQWSNSAPHGLGIYQWPDGKMYEGGYLQDKKHGFGILSEPGKPPVKGFWQGGELSTL